MSFTPMLSAVVKSVSDAGSGGWTAIASTPSVDRDGEVVAAGAFLPLPASIPVHDGHGWLDSRGGSATLIGRAVPRYNGSDLIVEGKFASDPAAQRVRALVREGVLAQMSVVFLTSTRKQIDGVRTVVKGELIGVDFVAAPANRDARVLSVRDGLGSLCDPRDVKAVLAQARLDIAAADALLAAQALDRLEHDSIPTAGTRAEVAHFLRNL